MNDNTNCNCVTQNMLIQIVVIILILILFYYVYQMYQNERFRNDPAALEGGYLSRSLEKSGGYVGVPLTQSIDDSGADLRILGTQFTSTDQGSERFRNNAKMYK